MAIFRRKTAKKQQRANKRNTRRQRGGSDSSDNEMSEGEGEAVAGPYAAGKKVKTGIAKGESARNEIRTDPGSERYGKREKKQKRKKQAREKARQAEAREQAQRVEAIEQARRVKAIEQARRLNEQPAPTPFGPPAASFGASAASFGPPAQPASPFGASAALQPAVLQPASASASSTSGARGIIDYRGVYGQEIPTDVFMNDNAKDFVQPFFDGATSGKPKEELLIDDLITLIHEVDDLAFEVNQDDGEAQFSEKYLRRDDDGEDILVAKGDPRDYMHIYHAFNAFLALKRYQQLIGEGKLDDEEFAKLVTKFIRENPATLAETLGSYLSKKFKDTSDAIKNGAKRVVEASYDQLQTTLKTPAGRHSFVTKCLLAAGGMYALGVAGAAASAALGITATGAALGAAAVTGFYVAKYGLLLSSYTVTAYGIAILGFFTAPIHVFYPVMTGLYFFFKKYPTLRTIEGIKQYFTTLGELLNLKEEMRRLIEQYFQDGILDKIFTIVRKIPNFGMKLAEFINDVAHALTSPGMRALEKAVEVVKATKVGIIKIKERQLQTRLIQINPEIAKHIMTTPDAAPAADVVEDVEKQGIQELFDGLAIGDPTYKETMELTGELGFNDIPLPTPEETADYQSMSARLEQKGHTRPSKLRPLFGPAGELILRPSDGGGAAPGGAGVLSGGGRRKRRRNTRNKRKKNRGSNRKRTKNNRNRKNKSR